MGRPRVKQAIVADWLAGQQRGTAREVAHGVQMSVRDTMWVLDRLQRAGEVTVVEHVRVEHAKRPVAVYELLEQRGESPAIFSDDWLRGR